MRKVLFLGLSGGIPSDFPAIHQRQHGEVWTCNKWWGSYLDFNPARVYQVHEDFMEKWAIREKYNGWLKRYSRAGMVRTVSDLGLKNQSLIDFEAIKAQWGVKFIGSSMSYMAADAIKEKVDAVEIYGFALRAEGEYEYQRPSAIMNVEAMRAAGINVTCYEYENWKKSEDDCLEKFKGCFMETHAYGSRKCMEVIDRMISDKELKKIELHCDFKVR
jgi:hypothetical protein